MPARRPISSASAALILCLLLAGSSVLEGPRAAVAVELRCQCIQHVSQVLPLKHIDSVTYYRPGPHCKAVEVIATMKSGLEHCLDPSAPWVKRMVKRILERYLRKCKEDRGMAQAAHGVA